MFAEFACVTFKGGRNFRTQSVQLVTRRWIRADESIGETDGAQLQRNKFQRLTIAKDRDLSRTAADVDVQIGHAFRSAALRRRQANQARLFETGKNLDVQSRFLFHCANELVGVIRFTHRRGGDSSDLLRAVRFSD